MIVHYADATHGVSLTITRDEAWDWAHRPGAAWPCATIDKPISLQMDANGDLLDCNANAEVDGHELHCMLADLLRRESRKRWRPRAVRTVLADLADEWAARAPRHLAVGWADPIALLADAANELLPAWTRRLAWDMMQARLLPRWLVDGLGLGGTRLSVHDRHQGVGRMHEGATMKFNDSMPEKASIVTFQLSLVGYDPEQGDQDHLVKWVNAPSKAALERFVERRKLKLDNRGVDVVGPHVLKSTNRKYQPYNLDDGVDCEIDSDGKITKGEIGDTNVRKRAPRSDRGKPRKNKTK